MLRERDLPTNLSELINKAGFFSLCIVKGTPQYQCYGKSVSLGIKSQVDDSLVLNKQMLSYFD